MRNAIGIRLTNFCQPLCCQGRHLIDVGIFLLLTVNFKNQASVKINCQYIGELSSVFLLVALFCIAFFCVIHHDNALMHKTFRNVHLIVVLNICQDAPIKRSFLNCWSPNYSQRNFMKVPIFPIFWGIKT